MNRLYYQGRMLKRERMTRWSNHLIFSLSNGAFTPDANEALSVSGLHVKSMQRHDRHNAA